MPKFFRVRAGLRLLTQGCGMTAALLAQPLLVSLEPGQAKAVQRQRCPISALRDGTGTALAAVPGLFLIRHKLAHERREQNDAADREEDASELQLIRQQQELSAADRLPIRATLFA